MKGGRGFGSPLQKLLNNYRMVRPVKESSLSLEVCKGLDWWEGSRALELIVRELGVGEGGSELEKGLGVQAEALKGEF